MVSLGTRVILAPRAWHAQLSLTLNKPKKNVMCSNLHTNSKHIQKTYQTWKELYAKQPTPDQNSGLVNG